MNEAAHPNPIVDQEDMLPEPADIEPAPRPVEPEFFADRERRNPYFRWLMHVVMPALVSLALHAAIFGVMASVTWHLVAPRQAGDGIEASLTASGADIGSGFKWPGERELSLVTPEIKPQIETTIFSPPTELPEMIRNESKTSSDDDSGGFGIGDSGRSGILGIGSGAGRGGGGGLGSGFGAGSGAGTAGVWNLSAAGNHFVYVVDFSGSITVAVDDLVRELKRSIGNLKSGQTFNVIVFYSAGDERRERVVTESFAPGLQPADTENKRRAFQWLDRKKPQGTTEPLPAIKRALSLKPDAIFFFTDGYFDDRLVDEITSANSDRKTHIHCLVFDEILLSDTSPDSKETDGARRLRRIAERNGGKTKVVTGRDLGRR